MLQVARIRKRMAELGLTEEALAKKGDAPLETLRAWLHGDGTPGPAKVRPFGVALGLSLAETLELVSLGEPALILHVEGSAPRETLSRLRDSAAQLHCSFAHLCTRPSRITSAPKTGSVDERAIVAATAARAQIGAPPGRPLTISELARLLKMQGAVLVPTPGRPREEALPAAVSIDCAKEKALFVLVNLSVPPARLAHALARAYAPMLGYQGLRGPELDDFSLKLATHLAPAVESEVTPVASTLEDIFGSTLLDPRVFVQKTEEVFKTRIFELLQDWQEANGGRNPSFIWSVLCCNLFEAEALTRVLWARRHSESGALRAA
jgi:hypothetical protein